ncbi:hypothetical protein [Nonomuraea indica]|uniref:hypothetical protein n=1 Tax=Nonomuraea indica TaxID=1581193 RepID=UPI0015DF5F50|nr:hypothetical protein [Nonomuraea indica]
MRLPKCCEDWLTAGKPMSEHVPVCEHQPPAPDVDPPQDALFDLSPPATDHQGGAHL